MPDTMPDVILKKLPYDALQFIFKRGHLNTVRQDVEEFASAYAKLVCGVERTFASNKCKSQLRFNRLRVTIWEAFLNLNPNFCLSSLKRSRLGGVVCLGSLTFELIGRPFRGKTLRQSSDE